MNQQYDDPNQQGGALATLADVGQQVADSVMDKLLALFTELKNKVDVQLGRIDRFDERLTALESIVQNISADHDRLQGRVASVSAMDLKNARMFPCAVCGTPNEFLPMPGETDEAAKNRVCCHKCGIPQGNPQMVERGRKALGKE